MVGCQPLVFFTGDNMMLVYIVDNFFLLYLLLLIFTGLLTYFYTLYWSTASHCTQFCFILWLLLVLAKNHFSSMFDILLLAPAELLIAVSFVPGPVFHVPSSRRCAPLGPFSVSTSPGLCCHTTSVFPCRF